MGKNQPRVPAPVVTPSCRTRSEPERDVPPADDRPPGRVHGQRSPHGRAVQGPPPAGCPRTRASSSCGRTSRDGRASPRPRRTAIAQPRRTAIMCGRRRGPHRRAPDLGRDRDRDRQPRSSSSHGPEAPGLDGSAARYVELLREAGAVEQDAPRREIVLRETVRVEGENGAEHHRRALERRASSLSLHARLPAVRSLAEPARRARRDRGDLLARDRSGAHVRHEGGGRAPPGARASGSARTSTTRSSTTRTARCGVTLRFPDEAARHKLLDLVGDLALLGCAPPRATSSRSRAATSSTSSS